MLDSNKSSSKPPMRIEIADYVEMGRIVVDWARDPSTRPRTVSELASQLDGIATVPKGFKNIAFVQNDGETLFLRLPEAPILEESMSEAEDEFSLRQYPLPYFYRDYFDPGFGPVMTTLDTLLARLGDQLAAQPR